jgi:heme oxygenase
MNDTLTTKEAFLKELRSQTGPSHAGLEQNGYSIALMSPGVTPEDYKVYLQKMYGVIAPFERDIQPKLAHIVGDIADRQKYHLIAEDLEAMGVDVASVPEYKFDITGDAEALGAMYVLEGSTMGGMVINKHVSTALNIQSKYFAAYGSDTAKMWRAFIEVLTTYAVDNKAEDTIIQSAINTFTVMDKWLSGNNQ